MIVAIPYKLSFTLELKYTLRGIEKYVNNPQVIIIGDRPNDLKNIEYIPYLSHPNLQWKERNIYEKLMLVEDDFIYFNDDHYLLAPFEKVYHYSGTLADKIKEYGNSQIKQTLINTIERIEVLWPMDHKPYNFYRHQPIFMYYDLLKSLHLDWSKEWGYCIKSLYVPVHFGYTVGSTMSEYPDLKIREPMNESCIRELIKNRPYFSSEDGAMNNDMVRVLESIYPFKSKYEA